MNSAAQRKARAHIRASYWRTSELQDPSYGLTISFTRPDVTKGYGAILSFLELNGPARKSTINTAIGVKKHYLSNTYSRITRAKLTKRCSKGYKLTKLGHAYVREWLGTEIH